jgi:hypothetical protein
LPQDFQEFSRADDSNSELRGAAHIPNIVRHKIHNSCFSRQLNEGFIIRVVCGRLPLGGWRETGARRLVGCGQA